MTAPLQLQIRTPAGLLYDAPVRAITAEDEGGWFGMLPGRADIIACLPPGLLTFRDSAGEETFVALSGGLLEQRSGVCRVLAQDAELGKNLEDLPEELAGDFRKRRARSVRRKGALADLEREALRRLMSEARS